MEATIQSNQMEVDKEEARPNPDLASLPQEDMSGGFQSCPHSPRSTPTNFHVNSEPELIEGNILKAEPFTSCINRNISVPIQKLVQSSKRRGVRNMPKPLEGGPKLLLTHQELSASGEYCRRLRMVEKIVLQRQGQKYKELVEEPKSLNHRPEERVGNDPSFGGRSNSGIYQLQTSFRSFQIQAQRTS
ncbi:hypothetical protein O181_065287 [Austropuccinia psidii MF-1]|uniref:Uncharacterized protein n=1 Tax=Austropuccinia psidii MF-1 TaxID=1389203 RepID=A0A9Q3EX64_9BASI|nr:hypothetical protein [Austropuccinia psidii MF-1]